MCFSNAEQFPVAFQYTTANYVVLTFVDIVCLCVHAMQAYPVHPGNSRCQHHWTA